VAQREAVLSVIVDAWGGMHPGGWRHPDAPTDVAMDFERVKQMVQTAERGKLHMFFLADSLGPDTEKDPEVVALTSNAVKFEPFTLCSALAMVTSRIGLAMTASTTYSAPFNLARMFASLDHLSGGRACWNVVASTGDAAQNFNNFLVGHDERYARASEFCDTVMALWDSWEDDAFIRDKKTGVYFDAGKLHVPNHHGEYFQVEGPLSVSRPIQGHPVIAQAGASRAGLAFATRVADLLFTLEAPLEQAPAIYADIKEQAAGHGRDPDNVKVISSMVPVLGRTQVEADERLGQLDGLADARIGIERLKPLMNFDLSGYPLDGPVPVDDVPRTEHGSATMQSYYLERARKENLTVRELAQIAMQFGAVAMSTQAIADHIEERMTTYAADGFNICFGDANGSLDLFVDEVVPDLQRRGLFRQEYRGTTLRENLGIARPQNQFTAPGVA
jgi:FMN-dependent oxidoreductase (nitrilotriacetate monooxygenase family)